MKKVEHIYREASKLFACYGFEKFIGGVIEKQKALKYYLPRSICATKTHL